MKDAFVIIMTTVLINNVVLVQTMGVCPFIGTGSSMRECRGMSCAVFVIMVLSSAATWAVYNLVLVPLGIKYMETIIFVLIIAGMVQICEIVVKALAPRLSEGLGIYLPLVTTNCAILGLCEQNVMDGNSFPVSMLYAAGTGLGFGLAMFLFTGIKERIENNDFPESVRGPAAWLISAAIMGLAFMGLSGLTEGLFGM